MSVTDAMVLQGLCIYSSIGTALVGTVQDSSQQSLGNVRHGQICLRPPTLAHCPSPSQVNLCTGSFLRSCVFGMTNTNINGFTLELTHRCQSCERHHGTRCTACGRPQADCGVAFDNTVICHNGLVVTTMTVFIMQT